MSTFGTGTFGDGRFGDPSYEFVAGQYKRIAWKVRWDEGYEGKIGFAVPELENMRYAAPQMEQGELPTAFALNPDDLLPGRVEGGGGLGHIAAETIIGSDIQAGSVHADRLVSNSITATQIKAGSITSNELSVASLDAISGRMGELAAGIITLDGSTLLPASGSGSGSGEDLSALIQSSENHPKVVFDEDGITKTDDEGVQVLTVGPSTNISIRQAEDLKYIEDKFTQTSGDLNGKVSTSGDTWATYNASTDFTIDAINHMLQRTKVSDPSTSSNYSYIPSARIAVCGTKDFIHPVAEFTMRASATFTDYEFGIVYDWHDHSNFSFVGFSTLPPNSGGSFIGSISGRVVSGVVTNSTWLSGYNGPHWLGGFPDIADMRFKFYVRDNHIELEYTNLSNGRQITRTIGKYPTSLTNSRVGLYEAYPSAAANTRKFFNWSVREDLSFTTSQRKIKFTDDLGTERLQLSTMRAAPGTELGRLTTEDSTAQTLTGIEVVKDEIDQFISVRAGKKSRKLLDANFQSDFLESRGPAYISWVHDDDNFLPHGTWGNNPIALYPQVDTGAGLYGSPKPHILPGSGSEARERVYPRVPGLYLVTFSWLSSQGTAKRTKLGAIYYQGYNGGSFVPAYIGNAASDTPAAGGNIAVLVEVTPAHVAADYFFSTANFHLDDSGGTYLNFHTWYFSMVRLRAL